MQIIASPPLTLFPKLYCVKFINLLHWGCLGQHHVIIDGKKCASGSWKVLNLSLFSVELITDRRKSNLKNILFSISLFDSFKALLEVKEEISC